VLRPRKPEERAMELTARRYAPALFGLLAFLIIAACPCTARASSDDVDDLDVHLEVDLCLSCHRPCEAKPLGRVDGTPSFTHPSQAFAA
jgi:hypothetical protein